MLHVLFPGWGGSSWSSLGWHCTRLSIEDGSLSSRTVRCLDRWMCFGPSTRTHWVRRCPYGLRSQVCAREGLLGTGRQYRLAPCELVTALTRTGKCDDTRTGCSRVCTMILRRWLFRRCSLYAASCRCSLRQSFCSSILRIMLSVWSKKFYWVKKVSSGYNIAGI